MESDTVLVKDSGSGDEKIWEEGRVLTMSVLYWKEEETEEKDKKRTAAVKMTVFGTFCPIVNKKSKVIMPSVTSNVEDRCKYT